MEAFEISNGNRWVIVIRNREKLVMEIDLERCDRGKRLPENLLQLKVNGECLPVNTFTVEDRIKEALDLLIY